MVPVGGEYIRTPGEVDDPLGEDGDSPVPGLVHRYPDRVLVGDELSFDLLPLLRTFADGRAGWRKKSEEKRCRARD